MRLITLILATSLLAAPALATHWDEFSATADCECWSMTGLITVGSLGLDGQMEWTVTLTQEAATVEEFSGVIPFDATGPLNISLGDCWSGELCGDYTASGVFTITGVDNVTGDPVQSFEVMFTCECDEPEVCNYTPGYWKTHPEDWAQSAFTVGCVDYTHEQLMGILWEPVRGDATIILAHHLISAMLNVMGGSDDYIQGAIDDGNQFLCDHGYGSRPSGADKAEALAIKNELAGYNELGCEDEEPMDPYKALPVDEQIDWGSVKTLYR
jgi:hypothetical protein